MNSSCSTEFYRTGSWWRKWIKCVCGSVTHIEFSDWRPEVGPITWNRVRACGRIVFWSEVSLAKRPNMATPSCSYVTFVGSWFMVCLNYESEIISTGDNWKYNGYRRVHLHALYSEWRVAMYLGLANSVGETDDCCLFKALRRSSIPVGWLIDQSYGVSWINNTKREWLFRVFTASKVSTTKGTCWRSAWRRARHRLVHCWRFSSAYSSISSLVGYIRAVCS